MARPVAASAAIVLRPSDITTFRDDEPPPGKSPYVPGHRPGTDLRIVSYDPSWPARFERLAGLIHSALGSAVLALEHVGSTSVPGLDAKPIIDIDLTVADGGDESTYVPLLEPRGFQLAVREPWWYGHRMLRHSEPSCNLHVWSPDCPEPARHLIFRDWLRAHPEDRELYVQAKLQASEHAVDAGGHVMDYNAHKQALIREIYERAFLALGLR